jgi:xylose isomerase
MDILFNKSTCAQQQAHYLALAERYHERAARSLDQRIATGYMKVANIYKVIAQTLAEPNQRSGHDEQMC